MNLYLKPEEMKFLALSIVTTFDFVKQNQQDPNIPWTPESRKYMREMIEAGNSLKNKLQKLGFNVKQIEDIKVTQQDIDDSLTKES